MSAWAILEAQLNCLLLTNSSFLNYNGGCMTGGINLQYTQIACSNQVK